jgi:peptide chain release factor 3
MDPLELLSEIEAQLRITAVPVNWPIAAGADFRGLVDLQTLQADIFEKSTGETRAPYRSFDLATLEKSDVDPKVIAAVRDEVELVNSAGLSYDQQQFLAGEMTPVFFGSALRNYGLEHFLRGFLALSPPPGERQSDIGPVPVHRSDFAGFIFKIQANLDPKHRDRIAFMRVCAGRFRREMEVVHPRSGAKIRLKRAQQVFGRERETVEEAFPGDIVGLTNPGVFRLGDTLCEGAPVNFEALPHFAAEHFATLRCPDTGRRKQFERGLSQLIEEGAVQVFTDPRASQRESILGVVGELQFDVVRYRLENEYQTQTAITWLPYKFVRWVAPREEVVAPAPLRIPLACRRVVDGWGGNAVLLGSQWDCDQLARQNPDYRVSALAVDSDAGVVISLE